MEAITLGRYRLQASRKVSLDRIGAPLTLSDKEHHIKSSRTFPLAERLDVKCRCDNVQLDRRK